MATASILLRLKNEAKHVGSVMRALATQTFSDYEIVVVDSGSTDGTLDIVSAYPIKLVQIRPEQFSYGYALNVGAQHATGRYIVGLSGHSIPTGDRWLEHLIEACSPPWAAASYSRLVPYPGGPWRYNLIYAYLYPSRWRRQFGQHAFHNASSCVKADLWRRFAFDERLPACEDQDWGHRVRRLGYELVYEPRSAIYHAHDESIPRYLERTLLREMPAFLRVWWRYERPRFSTAPEPAGVSEERQNQEWPV